VLVTDKTKIAKSFNEYFSNIVPLLAKKIQKTDVSCLSFLKGDFKNSFSILDTTPHEIAYVITPTLKQAGMVQTEHPMLKLTVRHMIL